MGWTNLVRQRHLCLHFKNQFLILTQVTKISGLICNNQTDYIADNAWLHWFCVLQNCHNYIKQSTSKRTLTKGKDTNGSEKKQSIEVYAGVA